MSECMAVTDLAAELSEIPHLSVRRAVPAARCTTIACGGSFELLVEPANLTALHAALQVLRRHHVAPRTLGAGSNLLVSDRGCGEVVLRLGSGFRSCERRGERHVQVGASYGLMALSRWSAAEGLSGLEFAGGIPASLGGAVVMNAGAHGGELAEVLESVDLLVDGEPLTLAASELQCSYRRTVLPPSAIVLGALLALVPDRSGRANELRAQNLARRRATQPLTLPSFGSVFKNPTGERSAGWYIEQCGLKGVRVGGAQVSELHGNWIVNPERRAMTGEVLELMQRCQEVVQQRFGVMLEPEVVRW